MKILLATGIYPPESGGPATFTKDLAAALSGAGHTVSVITYGDESTIHEPVSVTVISRKGGVLLRYIRYFRQVFLLTKSVDILFVQGPVSEGIPVLIAATLRRKPFLLKVVGDVAWESAQREGYRKTLEDFLNDDQLSLKTRILRIGERWVARRAARIVVPSRYLSRIVRAWGVPEDRITVIYNAVHRVALDKTSEELKQMFRLEGKRALLAGGRLVPWKRVDMLIQALCLRPKTEMLVVAGEGGSREEWQRLAERSGVADQIIWLGRCCTAELASWYTIADVFLLPSLYEGLPHMPLEAAQYGCPSLVSEHGGNPEAAELYPESIHVVRSDAPEVWADALDSVSRTTRVAPKASWTQSDQMRAYELWIRSR